jgi:hypothetical protein
MHSGWFTMQSTALNARSGEARRIHAYTHDPQDTPYCTVSHYASNTIKPGTDIHWNGSHTNSLAYHTRFIKPHARTHMHAVNTIPMLTVVLPCSAIKCRPVAVGPYKQLRQQGIITCW